MQMYSFERMVLVFIGAMTIALFVVAVYFPQNSSTHSPKVANLVTVSSLSETFNQIKYDFNSIRKGKVPVPRLFVKSLPIDMGQIKATDEKKRLFLLSVLPLVLRVNDEILIERKKLKKLSKLAKNTNRLLVKDRLWLAVMEDKYKVKHGDLAELKRRVDIIPPSLALAQAAEESGWGTSRFVAEGNALFGQWTNGGERGLIPLKRMINQNHKIKIFGSLSDGVRAYARNLNSHQAYKAFRMNRSKMRRSGKTLDGPKLSLFLLSYSQRGKKYIRSLQMIIKSNRLEKFDRAKLNDKLVRLGIPIFS